DRDMPTALYDDDKFVGYFVGGIAIPDAERIREHARVVFTTYGLSAVGTSWQHMTAEVLATPRRNGTKQLAARIMRMGGDQDVTREIVDVVDVGTFLRKQKKDRMIA